MKLTHLLGATAIVGSFVAAPAAFAQDAGAAAGQSATEQVAEATDAEDDGDILVTGSRIARPNLDASTPVTALTAQDLVDSGDVSLGDAINQLPALRSTWSQANSTRSIGTAGLNLVDLRGQGVDRTLVLVNGRRHVTSVPGSYNVDINTIPNALLESIEVVTGGASAVYGSDAIAGVLNFKLKQNFEGLEARFQGGISDRGDRGSYVASIVAGRNFADSRGNIAVSAEYARQNVLLFNDRNEQTGAFTGTPGFFQNEITSQLVGGVLQNEPASGDGIPDQAYFPAVPYGSTFGNISLGGGVQTTCPSAQGTTPLAQYLARRAANCTGTFSPTTGAEFTDTYFFLNDGTLVRDRPALDLRPVGGGRFGGLSATGVEGAMLLPGLERINTNLLFNYEFSPALKFFFEGKYVNIKNDQTSTQPTFVNGTLTPSFFLDNPFLTDQARNQIRTIMGYVPGTAAYDTGGFTFFRFNNDIGTRAEVHKRETYRFVGGFRGDLSTTGNLNYEVAFNYGRTNTFYETGGNVDVAKFNAAANAVRNAAGQIVCRVNADTITTNDMPGCVPLNLFGEYNSSQAARDYVLYTSTRNQWAEELNAIASIAGDTSGMFELPGGPIGFAVGVEWRKEDAFSDYDDFTQTGATFLNSISAFDPPAVDVYEGFGELRVPILKDTFIHELSIEGAARYSKYSSLDEGVWAYNYGAVFAPIRDVRFRVGYAKSVRAPNLSDLYATRSQTFTNNFVDPCSQGNPITTNPNRVRNCAAAGVPTTLTYTDDAGTTRTIPWINTASSGIIGFNQGALDLFPETGKSFTVGAVFEPRFLPGFAVSVDYYNIRVENVIASLGGQALIDRCYDDPVGLDNLFCRAISRRTSTNAVVNGTFAGQQNRTLAGVANNSRDFAGVPNTSSYTNQPFNYAQQKTSGIDADISYRHTFANGLKFTYRAIVSWVENREQFTFASDPARSLRLHATLGDPIWKGRMSAGVEYRGLDINYDLNYIGKQTIGVWELQNSWQGRPPTNADSFPFIYYPAQDTHDVQVGYRVNDQFRAYVGVDNIADTLPPYGATGVGAASGIYGVVGRFFYAGANVKF